MFAYCTAEAGGLAPASFLALGTDPRHTKLNRALRSVPPAALVLHGLQQFMILGEYDLAMLTFVLSVLPVRNSGFVLGITDRILHLAHGILNFAL
jgi:uncharacterized sodium:solute symporter family permease YidK